MISENPYEWMNLLLMMNILTYIQHDGREKQKEKENKGKDTRMHNKPYTKTPNTAEQERGLSAARLLITSPNTKRLSLL